MAATTRARLLGAASAERSVRVQSRNLFLSASRSSGGSSCITPDIPKTAKFARENDGSASGAWR
jgi:hypothetical protein